MIIITMKIEMDMARMIVHFCRGKKLSSDEKELNISSVQTFWHKCVLTETNYFCLVICQFHQNFTNSFCADIVLPKNYKDKM